MARLEWLGLGIALLLIRLGGFFLNGYSWHRDELYYLDCARWLSWGYVDHTLLTPLLSLLAFDSRLGILLLTTVLHFLCVFLSAKCVRAAGGDSVRQRLGALIIGFSPGFLAGSTLYGSVLVEHVSALFVVWAWLSNRHVLVASFLAGLAKPQAALLSLLLAIQSRNLGGAVATLLGLAPFAVWQATHGFPVLAFSQSLRADGDGPAMYVLMSALLIGPISVVIFLKNRRWNQESMMLTFAFFLFLLSGGKPYYLLPFTLPFLIKTIATVERPERWQLPATLSAAILVLPFWPMLPVQVLRGPLGQVITAHSERVGWEAFEQRLRSENPRAVICANYGQAGMVRRAFPNLPVFCGHNQNHFWPSPDWSGEAIVVGGYSKNWLIKRFEKVEALAPFDNMEGISNEEQGQLWYRVSGLREGLILKSELKHFD